jgi:NAD(P)-dependent dehydrogenase (short-subunit alcohol dehydrogenase family)
MNNGNDRTAIITGGSRGLGRNTAVNLARRGVDVIFTYHSNAAEARARWPGSWSNRCVKASTGKVCMLRDWCARQDFYAFDADLFGLATVGHLKVKLWTRCPTVDVCTPGAAALPLVCSSLSVYCINSCPSSKRVPRVHCKRHS